MQILRFKKLLKIETPESARFPEKRSFLCRDPIRACPKNRQATYYVFKRTDKIGSLPYRYR
ncbi:hypothetical protein LEP1GSC193_2812 [Leptospira alstonii serovar Pingchang str. 80-412]|uniref:Uncharacterized protein n=2 Tax=Leptospira alstonii TaxID=28452 RepID=M6DAV9_9LEPT|nr:hypothetical protein LEP1GSC194_0096 [Leptospira alstonii serovar Sichuan str. 79601]EQA79153.1 hypothetical protein LEP1GSC193_2812 [Leptospira alstonii serovar Pingchang str. 80-412]